MSSISNIILPDGSSYDVKDKRLVTLTQAQYNQLSPAEKADDIVYVVTDDNTIPATNVSYDNTQSFLTANNSQRAIDELGAALQQEIAYVEAGTTATKQYYVGDNFCLNGKLYRAIAQIATGETFVPDTNCKRTTLSPLVAGIWQNPNGDAAFAGQTISLDTSMYDLLLFEYITERTLVTSRNQMVVRPNGQAILVQGLRIPSSATIPLAYQRTITSSRTSIVFSDGQEKSFSAVARATNNNAIWPVRIYGIRM